jgi:pimeloyl-ACP methyl ester carboxylesterase
MGTNNGLKHDTFKALQERVREIHRSSGEKVSLVGWNLGGFYVRALANSEQQAVRSIVTIGTAFCMPTPRAVNRAITRLYSYLNPYQGSDEFFLGSELWETTPAVPSTSIYSKGDGINDWHYCLDKPGANTENVRVFGSHSGLTINAMVFHVLANRLAQQPQSWRPYPQSVLMQGAHVGIAAAG